MGAGRPRTFANTGVAEDAVNREPVSASNSLLTGKNTGKFAEWSRFAPGWVPSIGE